MCVFVTSGSSHHPRHVTSISLPFSTRCVYFLSSRECALIPSILRVAPSPLCSCLPRPGRGGKPHVLSSLPPLEISCLSFCKPCPLFSIACGLFSKNTGGGMSGEHTHPFSRRSACGAVSTFRINTSKSVSKQTTLSSFRINTCEKPGGGGSVRK